MKPKFVITSLNLKRRGTIEIVDEYLNSSDTPNGYKLHSFAFQNTYWVYFLWRRM